MKQLTGLDASFLYMETGRAFLHVSSLSIYARPDDPSFSPFDSFRAQLAARLDVVEPFRRKLVDVPLGLDRPYWVIDPDFDLDFHVRHLAIPTPGSDEQLADQVARIIGQQLDRRRPLWEVYVIEGLGSGDFAVLTKVHHATIDGASGAELLVMLLNQTPSHDIPAPALLTRPDRHPSDLEMLNRTLLSYARTPTKSVRLGLSLVQRFATATRSTGLTETVRLLRGALPGRADDGSADRAPLLPKLAAPATPFNKMISAQRRVAIRSTPLADVKAIKTSLGVTVNDVVLAVCTGGLRTYLQRHDALPHDPLVAMIPISIRTGDEDDRWTNRVSALTADLPTHLADPIERVMAVHAAMNDAKLRFDLLPADALIEISSLAPPALATRAARMVATVRLADHVTPPFNLVVSNVPGPRQPLYLGPARLLHYFPISTVVDGQGLNMTVQSYCDELDFGFVACRNLVPDLWVLIDDCIAEIANLLAATNSRSTAKPAVNPRLRRTLARDRR